MTNVLDFNDAGPQGYHELIDRLNEHHVAVLQHIWPKGGWVGDEFMVGNVRGDDGDSLSVSCRKGKMGVGGDFATGEKFDNLLECWAAARGVSPSTSAFFDVRDEIESFLETAEEAERNAKRRSSDWQRPKKKVKQRPFMGAPTKTHMYRDANGKLIAQMYRYDYTDEKTGKRKKHFEPWDIAQHKTAFPLGNRPMFNQDGILHEDHVVFVEGEKSAEALIEKGIPATCVMGGSNTDMGKIDWSPIAGKHVIIWPDADEPGLKFGRLVDHACRINGAASTAMVPVPEGKDGGWDAADAIEEGLDIGAILGTRVANNPPPNVVSIEEAVTGQELDDASAKPFPEPLSAEEFNADPQPIEWLLEGVLQRTGSMLLAAHGGSGKSFMALDLCLQVASDRQSELPILGGKVSRHGTVVFLTAEDDKKEIVRRIAAIDPDGSRRRSCGDRLKIFTMSDTDDLDPFAGKDGRGYQNTEFFVRFLSYLKTLDDVALIVIDPLFHFFAFDISVDQLACREIWRVANHIRRTSDAAVIVLHHMNKEISGKPIRSKQEAKSQITGGAQLLSSFRTSMAMWEVEPDEGKAICHLLGKQWRPGRVFKGAMVKANGADDGKEVTFIRMESGLLTDLTERVELAKIGEDQNLLDDMIVEHLACFADQGLPRKFEGRNKVGFVYPESRENLPPPIARIGRDKMRAVIKRLLGGDSPRLRMCSSYMSTDQVYLDASDSKFAPKAVPHRQGSLLMPDEWRAAKLGGDPGLTEWYEEQCMKIIGYVR